jgi:hypothetical protein
MHPEIRRNGPGSCPICGMALETLVAAPDTGPNPELIDMTRRFWGGFALGLPVFLLEMGGTSSPGCTILCRWGSPSGSSCSWRRQSSYGRDGRFSSGPGSRW